MSYKQQREAFNHVKANLSDDIKTEYETAVNTVVKDYNTAIRENRFIVGGAVEIYTHALIQSTGVICKHMSGEDVGYDILLTGNHELSLKSQFTERLGAVKLINKQGQGYRDWKTPTFLILSRVGILYVDPDMVDVKEEIKDASDSIELKAKAIKRLTQEPKNYIEMDIKTKPTRWSAGNKPTASELVAFSILDSENLHKLKENCG